MNMVPKASNLVADHAIQLEPDQEAEPADQPADDDLEKLHRLILDASASHPEDDPGGKEQDERPDPVWPVAVIGQQNADKAQGYEHYGDKVPHGLTSFVGITVSYQKSAPSQEN